MLVTILVGTCCSKSATGAAQYYTLPQSEIEVLEQLYRSTNGKQWTTATNWLSSKVHYCNWYGITCGEAQGGINKIQLINNNLVGIIPEDVFGLPELKIVNFNGNTRLKIAASGQNSSYYTQRSPVESLKLENTGIGTKMSYVFQLISSLSNTLKSLYLSDNDFGGIEIPQEITGLPNLEQLYISGCNFSGNFPSHIGELKGLQVLDASKNSFNGFVPSDIGLLSNLIQLDLSNNLLSGTLPAQHLGQLQKLQILSIIGPIYSMSDATLENGVTNQMLKGRAMAYDKNLGITGPLPDFSLLPQLRELHLSNNRLTGSIPSSFLGGIADTNAMLTVDLRSNVMTGVVPQSLMRFTSLDIFITDNNFRSIPDSLCSMKKWMTGAVNYYRCDAIACPRNTYSSTGRQSTDEICQTCGSNEMAPYIGSTSCMTFSDATEKLTWKERMILLDFYDAAGGENWTIATNWGQNATQSLCTWHGVACAPSSDSPTGIVQSLILPDNNLVGKPTSSIFDLQALETLILSRNEINLVLNNIGSQGDVSQVINLQLDNTATSSLEGISSIAISLQTLRATHAMLSGGIPQEIYSLSNLRDLRLDNNKLTGTLSSKIALLTNLQYLSLSGNSLSGTIPTGIGNLNKLVVLNFAENMWVGSIPQEILALTLLETLDFSDWNHEENGIKGQLPDFSNNKNLKSLLLAGNSLSGAIPDTFLGGISNVYEDIHVDLRWNILTGTIPKALARLEKVELLLTGNSLTGTIPDVLCTKKYWMNGQVSEYGCNAILCPSGTYNSIGRQIKASEPCRACSESYVANQLGTMGSCEFVSERTKQKEREREILSTFYKWTNGEKWKRRDNWLSDSVDICHWYGVSCNNNSDIIGWIERISLPGNNLSGKSPSDIFDLSALNAIDLSNNRLRFQFNGINRTVNLIDLNLASTATEDITGLSKANLLHLSLSKNNLSSYFYFPEEILQMTSLQSLQLSECGLGGTLPDAIGDLVQLKELDLYGNEFMGQLPDSVSNLRNMVNLTLSSNGFYGTLPEGFSALVHLETLHLDNNAASENGGFVGPLPDFSGLVSIRNLYLGSNSFSGTIPSSFLGGGIDTHVPMKIDLRWNQLRGTVPVTLDRFDSLEIYLSGNYLESINEALCSNMLWMKGALASYGCDAILCPIGSYSNLGRQALDYMPCEPCDSSTIAPYMGSTSCIKRDEYQEKERSALITLYNATGGSHWRKRDNWLTKLDVCTWFGVRCERDQVVGLALADNNLTGSFPSIVLELPFLEELTLSGNNIAFTFDLIAVAKTLKQLHLNNTLTKSLRGIGSAKNLTILNLSGNQFEQSIPTELYQLRLLRELDISLSSFQGTLSPEIANLDALEILKCRGNFISGSIPYQIGSLLNLRVLDLSNNKLTGTIPSSFLQLGYLEHLSLMNQTASDGVGLSGRLLSFHTNQALVEIELRNNQLTGSIPSNFLYAVDPSSAISVDLRSNQLSGNIPDELIKFEYLNIQLGENKIEQMPPSFCSKTKWMSGKVKMYGCDAILCPAGTFNAATGRQESNTSKCETCLGNYHTSPYLGVRNCTVFDLKERSVLESIYKSCNGETWYYNENWMNKDADICHWHGISCDESGSVAAINLEANNLRGTFPIDVYSLASLTEININSNPVTVLFDGIGNATHLEILKVDSTGLSSLNDIGRAKSLKEIHARFNVLQGSLPYEMSNLQSLTILDLSDNNLSGQLPSFLGDLAALESLQLGSNKISGSLIDFSTLKSLATLDLSHNSITGTIPSTFLHSVNSSQTVFVDLSANQISGSIPSNLTRLDNLSIHLKENRIEGFDPALCQKTNWFDEDVGLYGCDGILCPKGTFNYVGRQSTNENPCAECKESQYYGSTSCFSSYTAKTHSSLRDVSSSASSKSRNPGIEIRGTTVPLFSFAIFFGFLFVI